MAAMTCPPYPRHSQTLSISLNLTDSLVTLAPARDRPVLNLTIKDVRKTASIILNISTGHVTAKKWLTGLVRNGGKIEQL